MEKESTDGFGSLFLLFLAILAITCFLELSDIKDKRASFSDKQAEFVDVLATPDTAVLVSARVAAKQRLIF